MMARFEVADPYINRQRRSISTTAPTSSASLIFFKQEMLTAESGGYLFAKFFEVF